MICLSACGGVVTTPIAPQTSAPLTLPPTWTPTPTETAVPTATQIATFTPVPAFTPLAYPTHDALGELFDTFQQSLYSPNGRWVAYRQSNAVSVVNDEKRQTWTLPCVLFDECSVLFPLKWSRDSQVLYFAPAPENSISPMGIHLFTALAMITVRSGKWELLLPDSERYYDFTFSPDEKYLAYTQSSGSLSDDPSVTLGILRMKNRRVQKFTIDSVYGGNIVWSLYRNRFIFQVQDPGNGSSILYYDMDTGTLKYVIRAVRSDFSIGAWGEDNLVGLQTTDWLTHATTDWMLNPFTGDIQKATPTPTQEE